VASEGLLYPLRGEWKA